MDYTIQKLVGNASLLQSEKKTDFKGNSVAFLMGCDGCTCQ
jgi:hypothetical protein